MDILDSAHNLKRISFQKHAWEEESRWGSQYQHEFRVRAGNNSLKKRRLKDLGHRFSPSSHHCAEEAFGNYPRNICPTSANFSQYNFGSDDMKIFVGSNFNQSCELNDTEEDIFNLMSHLLHLEPGDLQAMELKALPGKAMFVGPHLMSSTSCSEDPIHCPSSAGRSQAYSQDSNKWSEQISEEDGESILEKKDPSLRNDPPSMRGDKLLNSTPKIKQEEIQFPADAGTPPSSSSNEECSFPLTLSSPDQSEEDYNGIRLVHLLVACAEAISLGSKDLAAVILSRLHQLTSFTGTAMQRIASYFVESLQAQLDEEQDQEEVTVRCENMTGTFQLLHETCPYIKFAHYTANQSILEVFEEENRLHIIDFDIMEGLQWPPLMAALASKGDSRISLQITAVRMTHPHGALYSSTQQTGRRLSEFAESLGLRFAFHEMLIGEDEEFNADRPSLNVMDEEVVAINCMVDLPHMSTRSVHAASTFVSILSGLKPKVITIAEDVLLQKTIPDFSERFIEILHHYCAIFDSLEATLPAHNLARTMVEALFLAPRISGVVTSSVCEHSEDRKQWRALVEAAGFQERDTSEQNYSQAKVLLTMFKEGFRVAKDKKELSLQWGDRSIVAVSTWEYNF